MGPDPSFTEADIQRHPGTDGREGAADQNDRDRAESPDLDSEQWRLGTAVRALDAIERPFTDFDRARWDHTSRERYISATEERYPEVFGQET